MTPTIKDVAKQANTSKSTVSRFLNGIPVNKKTEVAIVRAIEELNYHPNMNARRLVMDRTQEIGIVVDDISNRFYSPILKGIGQVLDTNGYNAVYYTWNNTYRRETDFLRLLYEEQVDGLIYVSFSRRDQADVAQMREAPFPVVLIGDNADIEDIHTVDVDNFSGIVELVHYLNRIGHHEIAYIAGPDNLGATKYRAAGYVSAMESLGLTINPDWICSSDWSNQGGYTAMKKLLQTRGFSAVIASNDESALGALTCLQEQGYSIPRDFSIVGFDDIDIAQWIFPSLTTVHQPFEQMGQTVAQFLMDCITEKQSDSNCRHLLKPELIIRNSSANP